MDASFSLCAVLDSNRNRNDDGLRIENNSRGNDGEESVEDSETTPPASAYFCQRVAKDNITNMSQSTSTCYEKKKMEKKHLGKVREGENEIAMATAKRRKLNFVETNIYRRS